MKSGFRLFHAPVPWSLPARGAWIEIENIRIKIFKVWSLPARGAWIEISAPGFQPVRGRVAPRKGSVD